MIHEPRTPTAPARPGGPLRRVRERRRLAELDRRAARLAELHHLRELLDAAGAVVRTGWVQGGWFGYRDESGTPRVAAARIASDLTGPVTGACLVGAIVRAGGGPAGVHRQLVRRALALTWHTLYGDGLPVQWCPPPSVHTAHVRDLTRWNDHPGRTAGDVTGLLAAASRAAAGRIEELRAV